MNRIALMLTALIASCSAHAGFKDDVATDGSANFIMGADSATGKIDRCGFEVRAYQARGTSKNNFFVKGMMGSIALMRADNGGMFAMSKMAGFTMDDKHPSPQLISINNWFIKASGQPAATTRGKIIDADNKPYKMAGMTTDAAIGIIVSIAAGLPMTWYFEPTKAGGAENFDATVTVDKGDKDKFMSCMKEMLEVNK